ncbi:bifunctional DNA primase/polymerase [Staphylococcus aureus]|uniref:bifunctional DNA primase/polymerase n=1 Tax=Staphylococcus aureus TaxID=1280 RepID=UPI0021D155FF|nr:bifunctional DNA primase/polymerase [Staphylococcus aureus]UXU41354.1 bifunctional DNA primase/polymerase [Staphylococcus aureus]UXU43977.1 bifunctional DNA primase/polymerase [Staphylococcus aureus]
MTGYHVAKQLLKKNIEVIPLNNHKKPTVSFADIDITDEFVEYNSNIYHKTNVLGVLTRGVWCIDIDVDHEDGKNGFVSLKQIPYYEELVTNAQNTLVQTTASGGKHIIFKKHDNIEYGQKIGYLPSVDIKAHPNNYFVLAGSQTAKGIYTHNGVNVTKYQGEFEKRIFSKAGNYKQQVLEPYSIRRALPNYSFSHVRVGKGGEGKRAYQRIIDGQSEYRNNDLFKAVSYAIQCNVDIEPLRVLIGDNKNGDVFTERDWEATVRSASR